MKNFSIFPLFIVFSLFHFASIGQNEYFINSLQNTPTIEVLEQQVDFRKEVRPALVVSIIAGEDDYAKDWKSFLEISYQIEPKKNSGYNEALKILIPEWSTDSLNIYYKTEKDGDGIRLVLLVESGGGFFNTLQFPNETTKIKSTVYGQVKNFYVKYYDKLTAEQQKVYDRQVKDMEKLTGAGLRLGNEIKNKESQITKTESSVASTQNSIKESENKNQSYHQQIETEKKELDLLKKELELNTSQVALRQKEYDQLNYRGELNSKRAIKLTKELEKMRTEQTKLQSKITSKNHDISDTDGDILASASVKSKLEIKVQEQKTEIDKLNSEIKELKREVDRAEKDKLDKEILVTGAKSVLDKLKSAKAALMSAQ